MDRVYTSAASVGKPIAALVLLVVTGLLLLDAGVAAGGWLAVAASFPLLTGAVPICSLTLLVAGRLAEPAPSARRR